MKQILSYSIVIVLLALSANVFSAHIGNVKIERIRVFDTYAVVQTDIPVNAPACAANTDNFYVPLPNSHAGNRRLSVLLTAHAQQKIVDPSCASQCSPATWLGPLTKCDEVSIQ